MGRTKQTAAKSSVGHLGPKRKPKPFKAKEMPWTINGPSNTKPKKKQNTSDTAIKPKATPKSKKNKADTTTNLALMRVMMSLLTVKLTVRYLRDSRMLWGRD